MIIQLFSGPMIDRVPLRGLLVYTQLSLGSAAHCACGALFRLLTVGLVLAITPILTMLNMWFYPAQMSALPKILDKKLLTQGNSLFSIAIKHRSGLQCVFRRFDYCTRRCFALFMELVGIFHRRSFVYPTENQNTNQ
ncbi:hypothetical protein [Paenibacillus lautus]|uniref:hypothetical protein n=1 Tax=Paenibacillus lautus TaxID=1401 RepID=UPI0039878D7D